MLFKYKKDWFTINRDGNKFTVINGVVEIPEEYKELAIAYGLIPYWNVSIPKPILELPEEIEYLSLWELTELFKKHFPNEIAPKKKTEILLALTK